jgi:hypothetical protein
VFQVKAGYKGIVYLSEVFLMEASPICSCDEVMHLRRRWGDAFLNPKFEHVKMRWSRVKGCTHAPEPKPYITLSRCSARLKVAATYDKLTRSRYCTECMHIKATPVQ